MRSPPMKISPAVGSLQPRDHAEQRGLAASGRAEQHQELALANREVHVVDRIELRESLC